MQKNWKLDPQSKLYFKYDVSEMVMIRIIVSFIYQNVLLSYYLQLRMKEKFILPIP